MKARQTSPWLAGFQRGEGPIYASILRALEGAIRSGELQPGDQLPPQRHVAEALGVDITTVTRAYGAARDRGWIEGTVGRGTFVSARALEDDAGTVDLSMNLPPPPAGVSLATLLRDTTAEVLQLGDPARLMSYHPGAGSRSQQGAGAAWLAPCLGQIAAERVLVTSGAQTALAAILNTIAPQGGKVVVEPLTYPGFKHIAARYGVELIPCDADEDGLLPEALERACRETSPAAVYLVPTLHNPTATTMSPERRARIARIATARDLWIIEDDPYSRLMVEPFPALATLAPQRTFYVSTLSKCLSPGLRVTYLVCPPGRMAAQLADNLRALSLMPSPMMTAIVTSWIRDGSAEALLAAVRVEAQARRRIARLALPQATSAAQESIHVWLELPPSWDSERLRQAAQARGLSLVTTDAFAVGAAHRNGVRISLGGPESQAVLTTALTSVAELVRQAPGARQMVV